MQKKALVTLISGAFAGVAGVANAGPISVASVTTYATEAISSSAVIGLPAVAYSLTNPFAAPSSQKVRFAIDSGSVQTCPTGTIAVGSVVISAATQLNSTTCEYTVTVSNATGVPTNTNINFSGGSVSGATALTTAGGVVNVTVSVLDNGNNLVESNSNVVARSANAWSVAALSSSALSTPETSRVDVTVSPPSSSFTNPTDVTNSTAFINLGRISITETSGNQMAPNGTTPVDFSTAGVLQTLDLTVTGTFAGTATVQLNEAANCAGSIVGAAFTINTARTSATITGVNLAGVATGSDGSGLTVKNVYICYTENTNTIPTSQFVASAGQFNAQGAAPFTTASGISSTNLYNLTLNGIQIDIRNHIPTSVTGWTNAYRIVNTGAVAASFTGQYIGVDGTAAATSGVIAANVPAGGVVVVSVPQVEAVLGAAPAGAPAGVGPRLRITAPTNSARVQVYGVQPNGAIFLNNDAIGAAADGGGTDK